MSRERPVEWHAAPCFDENVLSKLVAIVPFDLDESLRCPCGETRSTGALVEIVLQEAATTS